MNFSYSFFVVKGHQAKQAYYVGMVPLGLLGKLFSNEEEYVLPEFRAQRCISEVRIPEIRDYILQNRDSYVFSALSASIDGRFEYTAFTADETIGVLSVDMNAAFLLNDGQHRKAAIEAALKEDPSLANETISIVFFSDSGLKRSQQMFADLNKHAVKTSMSLSTLYDDRDNLANAVKTVIQQIPFLNKYIDKEKDNLGKNSSKLFTLANFLRANRRIVKGTPSEAEKVFLKKYWERIFNCIKEWNLLEEKVIFKKTLREDYILTLGVTLNAFGRLGKCFLDNKTQEIDLERLDQIDWLRNNEEWAGRIIAPNGKIINNEDSIIKLCNYFKQVLKIKLSKEEEIKEKNVKTSQKF